MRRGSSIHDCYQSDEERKERLQRNSIRTIGSSISTSRLNTTTTTERIQRISDNRHDEDHPNSKISRHGVCLKAEQSNPYIVSIFDTQSSPSRLCVFCRSCNDTIQSL